MASHSANKINLQPNKVCIHVAADSKYLTKRGGLTDFTIKNLYFMRIILSLKEVY